MSLMDPTPGLKEAARAALLYTAKPEAPARAAARSAVVMVAGLT
jgi:hypothetical protein